MKFSIVTATHLKNAYLDDLYDSLKEQTHSDWEWVLYLNGRAKLDNLPKEIREDSRVNIYVDVSGNNLVGYNKNRAFHRGTGDVLVEVDHDDMLTPDCLEELDKAFQDSSIGFVYSDNAVLHHQDNFIPYDGRFGWTYKTYNWKGRELISMNSFKPSSHSMAFIWYAPDHVRAWRKDVYVAIGGHDETMSVCDDHELMIRTYLNTKMHHIPKTLYIYRVTGDNTWLERNEEIQTLTRELCYCNAWELAVKDALDADLLVVDLGGGLNARPGCITIDQQDADINCDLNEGIPLADNSVGVLNASHLIEHLRDPIKTMSEIYRVLADGGWAFIEVPSTDGRGAWQDPTHVSFWNENSFWYYTQADKAAFIRNTTIRFQQVRLETEWWDQHIAVTHAWLVAVKGGERIPGPLSI